MLQWGSTGARVSCFVQKLQTSGGRGICVGAHLTQNRYAQKKRAQK